MNISHAQNRSCQSSSHRTGHWFLTSLTTHQVIFSRRPNIICVLEIGGEKKIIKISKLSKNFYVDDDASRVLR